MFKTRKGLLAIILLAILWSGGWHLSDLWKNDNRVHDLKISGSSRHHILDGDERGGGHRHGTGKDCKSEFPQSWSDREVIDHVMKVAANDNLNWRRQKNGYYVAEDTVGNVRMRVVLDRERDDVVTAYPLNTGRNPCSPLPPANDNDK